MKLVEVIHSLREFHPQDHLSRPLLVALDQVEHDHRLAIPLVKAIEMLLCCPVARIVTSDAYFWPGVQASARLLRPVKRNASPHLNDAAQSQSVRSSSSASSTISPTPACCCCCYSRIPIELRFHDLLRLDFVRHLPQVIDSSLQESGSREISASSRHQGYLQLLPERTKLHLIEETLNQRHYPSLLITLGDLLLDVEVVVCQVSVPHKHVLKPRYTTTGTATAVPRILSIEKKVLLQAVPQRVRVGEVKVLAEVHAHEESQVPLLVRLDSLLKPKVRNQVAATTTTTTTSGRSI
mmetsp:Transcript_2415/g.3872  ORF Transcript_2415/g.3872 Transcript_2415/m.3872 type:complete len:295 (-) Transcript_2415:543-1427(-)